MSYVLDFIEGGAPAPENINHAILPGATNAPIDCTITLAQVIRNQVVQGDDVYAASSNGLQIFCKLNITSLTEHQTITRALLKLKARGTVANGSYKVQKSNVRQVDSGITVNYLKYMIDNDDSSVGYYVADISKLISDSATKTVYLLIKGATQNETLSATLEGSALEIEYMHDNDHIPNVSKIEKQVGTKGAYSINARNGKLFYKQDLYQAPGCRMPFALSMIYNMADCDNSSPNGIPTGIKGWTFNYAQSFVADGADYKFLDSAHTYRRFVNADNSTTLWYDKDGRSGLTAFERPSGAYIEDAEGTSLKFDSRGRLTDILSQHGSAAITTTIEYGQNGKISYIDDGMGNRYDFTYDTAKITVSNDTTDLVELELNGETLDKVTYLLSGETVTYGYDNGKLTSVSDFGSLVKTGFSYYSNTKMIQSACSYTIDTDGSIKESLEGEFFTYKTLMTKVAHSRYSSTDDTAHSTTVYRFAQDGETIFVGEERDSTNFAHRYFRNKDDFDQYSFAVANDEVGNFKFNGLEEINGEFTNPNQSSGIAELYVEENENHRFVFGGQMNIIYSNLMDSPSSTEKLYIDLIENDEVVCTVAFDPYIEGLQSQFKYIDISAGLHQYTAVFRGNGKVKVKNVDCAIRETNFGLTGQYTTSATGQSSVTERKSDGTTTTWHHLGRCNIHYGSTDVYNVKYTVKDYTLTTISRLQNGNSFNIWYNDGANMIAGVSGASIEFLNENNQQTDTYSISDVKCCQVSQEMGKNVFSYIEPSNNHLLKAITNTVSTYMPSDSTVYANATGVTEYDNYFRKAYEVDNKGTTTEYFYNAYGELTEKKLTSPNISSDNVQAITTYDILGNVTTNKERRYLSDFVHRYTYTDNLLSGETMPNGFVQNYTYSNDKEKLTRIHTNDPSGVANDIEYANNLVTKMTHNNTAVTFEYNDRNDLQKVKIGTNEVMSKAYTYNSDGSLITVTTFGNGYKHKKQYDRFERLINESDVTDGETLLCSYIYSDEVVDDTITDPQDTSLKISSRSKLRAVIDNTIGRRTNYIYNVVGMLVETRNSVLTTEIEDLDFYGRTTGVSTTASGIKVSHNYEYSGFIDEELDSEAITSGENTLVEVEYTRDKLGRPTAEKITQGTKGLYTTFSYVPRQELVTRSGLLNIGETASPAAIVDPGVETTETVGTTPYIETVKHYTHNNGVNTLSKTEAVEYDGNGNITKYGGTTYQYDKMGRLVRENNATLDKTYVMAYNKGGNITSKKEYAYTTGSVGTATSTKSYSYGNTQWADKLTSYNGQSIAYDNMGNPTTYKGATLGWSRGRLLTSFTPSGSSITYNMAYDKDGVRRSKSYTSGSLEYYTTYAYNGTSLLSQKTSKLGGIPTTNTLRFLYVQNGLVGFISDGITYTYRKNLFGDIIGIFSGNTEKATYVYDAWGNCTVTKDIDGLGAINPFRYRGYYWDSNLGLYYLISRYYDPQTGRFINADTLDYLDPETLGGLNLYAYCGNNPVMGVDPDGHGLILSIILGAIFGLATSYASDVIANMHDGIDLSDLNTFTKENILKYLGATIGGAIGGMGSGFWSSVISSGVGNFVEATFSGDIACYKDVFVQLIVGGVFGAIGYGLTTGIVKSFADKKIYGILGNITDNLKVNKRLAIAGFGHLKIGKLGLEGVYNKLYTELGYETINQVLTSGFDIATGLFY